MVLAIRCRSSSGIFKSRCWSLSRLWLWSSQPSHGSAIDTWTRLCWPQPSRRGARSGLRRAEQFTDATTHFVGQSSIFTLTDQRATGEVYCLAHHVTVDGGKRRLMLPRSLPRHICEDGRCVAVCGTPALRRLGGGASTVMRASCQRCSTHFLPIMVAARFCEISRVKSSRKKWENKTEPWRSLITMAKLAPGKRAQQNSKALFNHRQVLFAKCVKTDQLGFLDREGQ